MSLVAMANENVNNSIDSDIVDSSPDNKCMDLQCNYYINAKGVFDNDESTNAFVCMACTGGSEDED